MKDKWLCTGRVLDDRWLEQGLPAVHEGRGEAGHRGGADLMGLVLRGKVNMHLNVTFII